MSMRTLAGKSLNARFRLLSTQSGDKSGDNPQVTSGQTFLYRGIPVEEKVATHTLTAELADRALLTHNRNKLKSRYGVRKRQLSTVSTAPTTTTTFISLKKDFK